MQPHQLTPVINFQTSMMGKRWMPQGILTLMALLLSLSIPNAQATLPGWWITTPNFSSVLSTNPAADYNALNQGQLKNLINSALDSLYNNISLPNRNSSNGGLTPDLYNFWTTIYTPTSQTADYNAVTIGQLKAAAKPFYDLLIQIKYTNGYPWISSPAGTVSDYAMANIGQAKYLFSFDLSSTDSAHDSNHDGIPDWWEHYYNITSADAPAIRGDGLSNLQAWQQGLNPNDFYNGSTPKIALVGGGGQFGAPGTTLTNPLSVQINNGQAGAPVTVAIQSGHALLSVNGGAPSNRVNFLTPTPVSVILPNIPGETSFITITTTTTNAVTPVLTSVSASDCGLPSPTNIQVVPTSPTTAELSWTPADLTQPTSIQVSLDGGADWSFIPVVPAGVTNTTLTGLIPDQPICARLSTGDYN